MSKDSNITLKRFGVLQPPRLTAKLVLSIGLALVALWFITGLFASVTAETLWFNHLGYLAVYWLRIITQTVVWIAIAGINGCYMGWNLRLAERWQHPHPTSGLDSESPSRIRQQRVLRRFQQPDDAAETPSRSRSWSFRWLLLFAVGVSLLTSLVVVYYGRALIDLGQFFLTNPLEAAPIIPNRLRFNLVLEFVRQLWQLQNPLSPFLGIGMWFTGAIALLVFPQNLLRAIAIFLSVGLGLIGTVNWSSLLLFFHGKSFNRLDPLFGRDIGFYIFSLPIWQLLEFWLVGLTLYTMLAVLLTYLLSGNSLSQGTFLGFSKRQQRHLSGVTATLMLAIALSYWLRRYELLYSSRGVVFGASYTEVYVQLPLFTVLSILALGLSLFLFWQIRPRSPQVHALPPSLKKTARTLSWSVILLASFCLVDISSTILLPWAVQRFIVQPNELTREETYIRRAIALTREAFNLENIQVETFNPLGNLTFAALQQNDPTIRNIRLWDTRPLLETNRQLQQIRPYYRFPDADIDRYTLLESPPDSTTTPNPTSSIKQQVLISARELDYDAVPPDAQTWVNEHLIYTHGYGFTLSPVNKVAPGGLPDYFVRDIGGRDTQSSGGNLTTSSEEIRASIPIGDPRIYFGEITNTYVMTGTSVQELDYPSGNDNVYNTYDGAGGIGIGSAWKRWIFARYLQDWQMLLTNSFKPETKVLFRRNIKERVEKIAPFLRYDQDPYIVAANIGCLGLDLGCDPQAIRASKQSPNYLYWIIDAYTVSDHYPYSEPSSLKGMELESGPSDRFNYIRNSVKVVVDAYNGSVKLYVADASDPIIQAWSSIFPNLFKPLTDLPSSLQAHIRYPLDLYSVQSERLLTYHMTDPQVFYNREDQWQISDEIYGNQPRQVEPYFLITNLPTVVEMEEFILLLPFKPIQRSNLIAWLAARSDGNNYGKQLLYVFPKQQLVFGIEQIEARINQDPVISQQITLWNRQGSRVLQGNLLVIPIEQSLLYVEPLYLESELNSLPTLVSVVVAYENRIAMATTLDQAFRAIFQAPETPLPAIVRPVE